MDKMCDMKQYLHLCSFSPAHWN